MTSRPGTAPSRSRSGSFRAALLILVPILAAAARPASAALELRNAPGIQVIPADEVLRDYVRPSADGGLWFFHPDGTGTPLVLSTADPQISNPGDGSFHPADETEVVRAIEMIPASLIGDLQVRVFILPYPRSGLLSSSADDHGIYLTPGVREYTAAQIHFLVGHELGHSYHRAYLPDSKAGGWDRYRELRGITDRERFASHADHAFRPHEIFAEDFRVLFAGTLGRGDGNVENREVARPQGVQGLSSFLAGLSGISGDVVEWLAYPNPLRRGDQLRLRGRGTPPASDAVLLDVSGREVASLPIVAGLAGEWNVEASQLQRLASGAYWLRISGTRTSVTVPLRWVR
jgi:hypothetical protein